MNASSGGKNWYSSAFHFFKSVWIFCNTMQFFMLLKNTHICYIFQFTLERTANIPTTIVWNGSKLLVTQKLTHKAFIVTHERLSVFNTKMDYKENDLLEGNTKITPNSFYRNSGPTLQRLLNLIFNNHFSCLSVAVLKTCTYYTVVKYHAFYFITVLIKLLKNNIFKNIHQIRSRTCRLAQLTLMPLWAVQVTSRTTDENQCIFPLDISELSEEEGIGWK